MTGIVNNDHIRELCNNLVLAVEQDVKQRLITRWQAEQHFQTGMHGEPINQARQKTRGQRGPISVIGGRVPSFTNCFGQSQPANMA